MTRKPAPKLKTVVFSVDDLTLFHKNARIGNVEAIAESLEELGQFRTIVVNTGTHTGRANEILAGNHTLQAAKLKGDKFIEATVLDVDDTTAEKIVAADNRTNDLATYDGDKLFDLLESIGRDNLKGTGFAEHDYDELEDLYDLPEPIEIPTTGKGTGKAAVADSVTWGYVTWAATRVLITKEEVDALDDLFKRFCADRGTDVGFGWLLANRSDQPPNWEEIEAAKAAAKADKPAPAKKAAAKKAPAKKKAGAKS